MNSLKNLSLISFSILWYSGLVQAQQEPMYTHYMNNTLSINSGYAGTRDVITATLLNRSQWVGFEGAPTTQTFTIHGPIKSEKIGLGFSFVHDKIGPSNYTSANIDLSYILNLNSKSKLSFGMKTGVNAKQANLASLDLDNPVDVAFQNNINSKLLPNFGFGSYYYRKRFYLGVSIPRLLENDFNNNKTIGKTGLTNEQRHYFLISGAMLKLSENMDFKPTTFVKFTSGAPLVVDLTASFILKKKLLLGTMFRTGDAVGALLGYDFTEQFHIGYSFDWSYGLKTSKYNNGTHEIMLCYDFIIFDRGRIRSPRYF